MRGILIHFCFLGPDASVREVITLEFQNSFQQFPGLKYSSPHSMGKEFWQQLWKKELFFPRSSNKYLFKSYWSRQITCLSLKQTHGQEDGLC